VDGAIVSSAGLLLHKYKQIWYDRPLHSQCQLTQKVPIVL